ncbi:hypothetical protein R6Q57_020103 [Mikania cordata]
MGRIHSMISTFTIIWFVLGFYNISSAYGNSEVDALIAFKKQLLDPNGVLQSWDRTLVNPCMWYHITCNIMDTVVRIDLGSANLTGRIVPQLGQLANLEYLELYNNNIRGIIPEQLGNLTRLVSLDLYQNKLQGHIPETLGKLQKLRFLDMSSNRLSGHVPINGSFAFFTPLSFANNPNLKFPAAVPLAPALHQLR